jgi:hypothetical protein
MVPASCTPCAPRPLHEPRHPPAATDAHAPEIAAFALAAAFHAAALGAGWLAPRPSVDVVWVPVVAEVEVDLAAEPAALAPILSSPEPGAPPASAGATSGPVTTSRSPFGAWRAPSRAPEPIPSVTAPVTAPPARTEYDGPPPAVPIGAGSTSVLPGPVWSPPSGGGAAAPAPTAVPRPVLDREIATRLLAGSMNERDRSLGLTLPAAGNVASALAAAVRTALGPTAGSATFMAILTPSGKVLGIRALAWNGGTQDAWTSAGRAAAASLSGRTFSMVAPFDNGAVVWVDVVSSFVLPSGASARVTPASGGFRFDVTDIGRQKQQIVRTTFRVAAVK